MLGKTILVMAAGALLVCLVAAAGAPPEAVACDLGDHGGALAASLPILW
jgi:hypothetical protein